METCNSCEFYEPPEMEHADNGRCRRKPPPWPLVRGDDWCGEHSEAMNITTMLRLICDTLCKEDVSGGG